MTSILFFQFHKRKQIILHIMMMVIILSMAPILLSHFELSASTNPLLNRMHLSHFITGTSSLLIPFMILFLTIDLHSPSFRAFDAYFGRSSMFGAKWSSAWLVYTYAFIVIAGIQESTLTLWTCVNPSLSILRLYLNVYSDGLLLLIFSFMLIRERHKTLSLLIPVLFIVMTMIVEDVAFIGMYYLFPISSSPFSSYQLAYPYKLCYILLVMIIAHQKSVLETL